MIKFLLLFMFVNQRYHIRVQPQLQKDDHRNIMKSFSMRLMILSMYLCDGLTNKSEEDTVQCCRIGIDA